MSTNNYILNLLNIKDENIHIITNCEKKVIKGKNYKIIEGILIYKPDKCPICGTVNNSFNDIIKWGFRKNCIVKILKQGNCLTRFILHKQRFFCKNCSNTFIVETSLVEKNKNISNNTDLTLKATYECYQGLINSLKNKDFNKFKAITFNQNKNLSPKMKQALKLYKENINYIENSFKYDINNGIIEGTNNLIKCIKSIAFGYRKYDHFIARIFLIKGIIKE